VPGTLLANGIYKADILCNECVSIPAANALAASWFYPNTVTIWEKEQFVLENTTSEERNLLSSELMHLKKSDKTKKDITWKIRRIVLAKR